MIEQPCDMVKVKGRPNVFRCVRKGCTHPWLRLPPRADTGQPWKICQFHPPACTVPYRMGLGDYVARAIETLLPWTKKKKCSGCKKRQEMLNEVGRKIIG